MTTSEPVYLPDPSLIYRPDIDNDEIMVVKDGYRDFTKSDKTGDIVRETYHKMHTHQTVDWGKQQREKWLKLDHAEFTIMEAVDKLIGIIDESDPDATFPNIYHAYQTAEQIRAKWPDKEWLHLCGFIHDLGKIMILYGQPQWSTVGDTFIVGCAPEDSVVFGADSFSDNPDMSDPRYNTKYGMYEPNCGFDNCLMSWGHDEYLYNVLTANQTDVPEETLYIIRYHSFYPWHATCAYKHLASDKDQNMLKWLKEFRLFDLYSKVEVLPDIENVKGYYQGLVDKYCPGKLKW